jgi:hypothetical protein
MALVACGGSDDDPTPATGGSGGNAGAAGTAGGAQGGAAGDAGSAGTAGTAGGGGSAGGATNIDCASAAPLKLNTKSVGYLFPKGTKLAYSVELKAGQFVVIDTASTSLLTDYNDQSPENYIDTALTVYDATNNQLAFDDDSVPRGGNPDSEMFYHSPIDQTVCIVVEDLYSLMGVPPNSYAKTKERAKFELLVSDLNPETVTLDTGANDDAAGAQPMLLTDASGTDYTAALAWVGGVLNPDTDVDVYSFKMPAGTKNLSFSTMPKGLGNPKEAISGFGSTILPGTISFSDPQGNVFARVDPSKYAFTGGSSYFDISVPVAENTDVLMWVKRPAGVALGANDFYFIKQMMSDATNDAELEPNDTLATANLTCAAGGTCTFPNRGTDPVQSYYLMGFIDPETDVDYIEFDGLAGDVVALACSAVRNGSGLIGATFSLRDSTDTDLQTETETADQDLLWSNVTEAEPSMPAPSLPANGKYYLRVSATGQSTEVSGNYYICGLHIQP